MNAVMKPKAQSAATLQATVVGLERMLAEAQREQSTLRSARPRLIAEGDELALAQNTNAVSLADRDVANIAVQLTETREALKIALDRERAEVRQAAYTAIQAQAKATREAIEQLDKAIAAFAKSYPAARDSINRLDAVLVDHGQSATDPYTQLKAGLDRLTERAMWLQSDGVFGKPHGMDSLDQLRSNGRASLKLAAHEFISVTLNRVRSALGVKE